MNKYLPSLSRIFGMLSMMILLGITTSSYAQQLACNDLVNVTLDLDCTAEVFPDLILEGATAADNQTHRVELYFDQNLTQLVPGSPFVGANTIGIIVYAKVINNASGNFCWGKVSTEDKFVPDLNCTTQTILCSADNSPEALGFPVPGSVTIFQTPIQQGTNEYTLVGFDSCGDAILTYSDRSQVNQCNPIREVISRTWTVTDESQNTKSCVQTINLRSATFSDLIMPPNLDGITQPSLKCDERCPDNPPFCGVTSIGWNVLPAGHPYAGHPNPDDDFYDCGNGVVRCVGSGAPSGVDCGDFNVTFADTRVNTCTSGPSESCYKIVRRWTILEWCTGAVEIRNQIIKVEDDEAPEITGLSDMEISVDVWRCEADWYGVEPWLFDNCSSDPLTYTVSSSAGVVEYLPQGGFVIRDLPLGVHQVTYTAADCCGNTRDEVINLTVIDDVPPIPNCDGRTVVSISSTPNPLDPNLGTTKIFATTLDDGSFDNCSNEVFFKILRMDEYDSNGNGKTPETVREGDWESIACDAVNGDDDLRTVPSFYRGPQSYFDDYAKFCCEDTGDTVMMVFRVYDIDPEPYTFGKVFPNLVPPGENPDDYNGVVPEFMEPGGPLYGRYNDCMVEVIVQDKKGPYVEAPPYITVSCDYWFPFDADNPQDYTDELDEIFGKVVPQSGTQFEDRDTIVIKDRVCPAHPRFRQFAPANPALDPCYDDRYDIDWGRDGYATDNCAVTIEQTITPDLECGRGEIIRRWRASDNSGNWSNIATQIITLIDCKEFIVPSLCWRFTPGDIGECIFTGGEYKTRLIEWPCDVDITRCQNNGPDGFLPENLSVTFDQDRRPRFDDDNCSLLGATYVDRTFTFVDNACVKIFRDWTVIDWCLFEDGVTPYEWEWTQVIKLLNSEGPTFDDCTDRTFCGFGNPNNPNANQCVGDVVIEPGITDDCSTADVIRTDYKIDAFNDGSFDIFGYSDNHPVNPFGAQTATVYSALTPNANGQYPVGTHRILWTAEDGCGNITSCDFLFTVEDCKPPTPYCRTGVSTIPMVPDAGGFVDIWASDFNIDSYDNCTIKDDLVYSFSDDPTDTQRTYTCADAPGSYELTVYVWDLGANGLPRNFATCEVEIQLTDCDMQTTYRVAGIIETEANQLMSEVMVKVDGDYSMAREFGGEYEYFLPRHYNYSITPEKNINHRNGVSTFDLVLISKHITGQQSLPTPYKLIAADVNNTGSVTTFDIIELRKLILYISTEFPNTPSWRFIPAEFQFNNPADPFESQFPEVYSINDLSEEMDIDFVAIKVGDVNGSARLQSSPTASTRSAGQLDFSVADQLLLAGETTTVEFKASDLAGKLGYQLSLAFDESVQVESIQAGALNQLNEANFAQHDQVIVSSWNDQAGAQIDEDAVVFSVQVTANKDVLLSEILSLDDMVSGEAYTENTEILDVNLTFSGQIETQQPSLVKAASTLGQNIPNPFAAQTTIPFTLAKAGTATLRVYDVRGKVLEVVQGDYTAGEHQITLDAASLGQVGVLYYSLETEDQLLTKRMLLVR